MNNTFIRPVYKQKDKLGRGETKVLYGSLEEAAYVYIASLLDTYGYKGSEFKISMGDGTNHIIIEPDNVEDYNEWNKIIALPAIHITGPLLPGLVAKPVSNTNTGFRYNRVELESAGYNETMAPLNEIVKVIVLPPPALGLEDPNEVQQGLDPFPEFEPDPFDKSPPLIQVVNFGNDYDLPVGGVSPKSWLGRIFSYLGGLVAKTEGGPCEYRKPFILFESKLGGHIGIYHSLTTHNEVDVALFDSHGGLVNVFSFQDGCPLRNGINGFTIEDLIGLSSWRILHVNSFVPSEHNANAYGSLQDAIDALDARSKERSK